jgi:hypothetical protein
MISIYFIAIRSFTGIASGTNRLSHLKIISGATRKAKRLYPIILSTAINGSLTRMIGEPAILAIPQLLNTYFYLSILCKNPFWSANVPIFKTNH